MNEKAESIIDTLRSQYKAVNVTLSYQKTMTRELSLAATNLEQSFMWAEKAIRAMYSEDCA